MKKLIFLSVQDDVEIDFVPDWERAPDWAQFYAIDKNLDAFWYEFMPIMDAQDCNWFHQVGTKIQFDENLDENKVNQDHWRAMMFERLS